MKLIGLHHLNLDVHDLETSVTFYTKVLDMTLFARNDWRAFLAFGPAELVLTRSEQQTADLGTFHFGFRMITPEDVEKWAKRLEGFGIPVRRGEGCEHSRSIYLHDPNGYEIEFYYNGHRPLIPEMHNFSDPGGEAAVKARPKPAPGHEAAAAAPKTASNPPAKRPDAPKPAAPSKPTPRPASKTPPKPAPKAVVKSAPKPVAKSAPKPAPKATKSAPAPVKKSAAGPATPKKGKTKPKSR